MTMNLIKGLKSVILTKTYSMDWSNSNIKLGVLGFSREGKKPIEIYIRFMRLGRLRCPGSAVRQSWRPRKAMV